MTVKLISRGHDLLATAELTDGRTVRALDVLTHYYEAAQSRYGGRDEEWLDEKSLAGAGQFQSQLCELREAAANESVGC